jgi:N-acetylglucosamine kinase-like BadF-type ATPase
MKYVLGVDQGHSQTRATLCDTDGNLLGLGITVGACHAVHGMDAAMAAIHEAGSLASAQAGIAAHQVDLVFGGLTGADWPEEYHLLQRNVATLGFSSNVRIKNDAIVAMRGGTWADYGAVATGGTGSNCAIRSPRGEEFVYGYYHDMDLQGGVALGRRAIAALSRAETGREPPTLLTQRVLDLFGKSGVDDLLRTHYTDRFSIDELRQMAPLVFQAASEGDIVACKILKSFGEGFAELVTAGLRRFDMTHLDVDVVLSGGVFKGPGRLVEETMIAGIHMVAPRARLINARYEPVVGAALWGLVELGVDPDDRLKHHVETSCRRLGLIRVET